MRYYGKRLIWLHTGKVLQVMWMAVVCPRYFELFISISDGRTYRRIYGLLNCCTFDQYRSCSGDFFRFVLSLLSGHTNLPPRSRVNTLNDHKRATRHCFCHHCDRFFNAILGLESRCKFLQHQKPTFQSYCHICEQRFARESAVNNHKRAPHMFGHKRCGKEIQNEEVEVAHRKAKQHCIGVDCHTRRPFCVS